MDDVNEWTETDKAFYEFLTTNRFTKSTMKYSFPGREYAVSGPLYRHDGYAVCRIFIIVGNKYYFTRGTYEDMKYDRLPELPKEK